MFSISEYPNYHKIRKCRERFTSVFDGIFDDDFFGPSTMSVLTHNTKPSATLNMQLDVKESDNAIELTADLPGVAKKDVTIEIKKGILTVSAERKSERTKRSIDGNKGEDKEEENAQSAVKWTRVERSYGSVSRTFQLPENIDEQNVVASMVDGVLKLHIPKVTPVEPAARSITVE